MNNSTQVQMYYMYLIIDEKTTQIFNNVINCGLMNGFSVFCIIGNLFNIIVLAHHGLNNSTNIILLSLAVLDLFYGATTFFKVSTTCLMAVFSLPLAADFSGCYSITVELLVKCTECIASSHVVYISIERMMAVYFPWTVSTLFSNRRTCIYIALCYVFWLIIYAPVFPVYKITYYFDAVIQRTRVLIVLSDFFWKSHEQIGIMSKIFLSGIRGPGFLAIISAASFATYYKLLKVMRTRTRLTSVSVKIDVRAVKMLVMVCLVYLALGIPSSVPVLLYYLADSELFYNNGMFTNLAWVLESLKELLYIIHSSMNFIIYVRMSKKFSQTYRVLIRKCCRSRRHTRCRSSVRIESSVITGRYTTVVSTRPDTTIVSTRPDTSSPVSTRSDTSSP